MPAKSCTALTPDEAAYIAGFVDGEGSIGIVAHNRPGTRGGQDRRTAHYRVVVAVTNKDVSVLQWIHERCGGSVFEKARKNPIWAPAFELRLTNRDDVRRMLEAIRPYVLVKAHQIKLALAFLDLGFSRITFTARGKTWPRRIQHPDDVQVRESLKQRMNALNQRGMRIA